MILGGSVDKSGGPFCICFTYMPDGREGIVVVEACRSI